MSTSNGIITPSAYSEYPDYQLYQNYTGPISRGTTADYHDARAIKDQSCSVSKESEESESFHNWCSENGALISAFEIENVFARLGEVFGFQKDNVSNMFEYFMTLLDSRAAELLAHLHYSPYTQITLEDLMLITKNGTFLPSSS